MKKPWRDRRLFDINENFITRLRYTKNNERHYKCSYCNSVIGEFSNDFSIDHIIPVSKGGSNELENLTPSCKKCNSIKNDKYE